MLQQTDSLHNWPFQEQFEQGNFYSGAGRGEVLQRLREAVATGVPLLVVTGAEGSGTSTLARMFHENLPARTVSVLFGGMVESFEEVVRLAAVRLGLDPGRFRPGGQLEVVIAEIVSRMRQEGLGLVLIFDQAEVIYLATLERVRRMLDRLAAEGVRMHLVFAGRHTFLDNFDRLAICDFAVDQAERITLSPLSEAETAAYLVHCLQRFWGGQDDQGIERTVIGDIYRSAQGNFRLTNQAAEEALINRQDDASFLTLLKTMEQELAPPAAPARAPRPKSWPQGNRRLLWAGGLAVTAVAALLFLFMAGERPEVVGPAETSLPAPPPPVAAPADISPAPATPDESATASAPPVPLNPIGEQEVDETAASEVPAAVTPSPPEGVATSPPSPVEPVALYPAKNMKKRPEREAPSRRGSIHLQARREVEKSTGVQPLSAEQLFQERLLAGTVWESGEKDHLYTVQLMVLTSPEAETNLKAILAEEESRRELDNLFIFVKGDRPKNLLVFYGEYPTMAAARTALGSLPPFLHGHKPYAISVKGAVAKIRR